MSTPFSDKSSIRYNDSCLVLIIYYQSNAILKIDCTAETNMNLFLTKSLKLNGFVTTVLLDTVYQNSVTTFNVVLAS